jgi:hypothetical protein
MGAHWQVYRLYTHFAKQGYLSNVNRVVDFGSCDTSCHNPALIKEFTDAMRGESFLSLEECANINHKPIFNMWNKLDIQSDAIDIDGRSSTIQLDLNLDAVPIEMHGKYNFVCDNGTFEHILNQTNCFRTAHDLCAVEGFIFYHKPFIGHYNHGFFNYQPDLFIQLAAANKYEIKGLWYGIDHDPGFQELDLAQQPDTHHSILFALLKKTNNDSFKLPYNFNGSDLMHKERTKYEK